MIAYFLDAAKAELEEAVSSYEHERKGLGEGFALEAEDALARILQFPHAWSALSKNVRRCRLNRFPYGIVYSLQNEEILIVAVMHLHRKPGYWKNRLKRGN